MVHLKNRNVQLVMHMSVFEISLIESQQNKLLVWFKYINFLFFCLNIREYKLETLVEHLNSFDPSFKFTHESSKEDLPFLNLKAKLSKGKIITAL